MRIFFFHSTFLTAGGLVTGTNASSSQTELVQSRGLSHSSRGAWQSMGHSVPMDVSMFLMTPWQTTFDVRSHLDILYINSLRPSVCDGFVFYLSRHGRATFSAPGRAARFGSTIRECCWGWGAGQARTTDWTEVGKLLPCERNVIRTLLRLLSFCCLFTLVI